METKNIVGIGIGGIVLGYAAYRLIPAPESVTWSFDSAGNTFKRSLPWNFRGEVILNNLPPATIPYQIQAVVWAPNYEEIPFPDFLFWTPGAPGCTLVSLVSGKTYMVGVTGPCEWTIPLV